MVLSNQVKYEIAIDVVQELKKMLKTPELPVTEKIEVVKLLLRLGQFPGFGGHHEDAN